MCSLNNILLSILSPGCTDLLEMRPNKFFEKFKNSSLEARQKGSYSFFRKEKSLNPKQPGMQVLIEKMVMLLSSVVIFFLKREVRTNDTCTAFCLLSGNAINKEMFHRQTIYSKRKTFSTAKQCLKEITNKDLLSNSDNET